MTSYVLTVCSVLYPGHSQGGSGAYPRNIKHEDGMPVHHGMYLQYNGSQISENGQTGLT